MQMRAITAQTLTGSAAIDGASGELGNELDSALLLGLRDWSDAIVVGAGTVRAEDYRAPRCAPEVASARRARGQTEAPRLVVVTRSLELSPDSPSGAGIFADDNPPTFLVGADPTPQLERKAEGLRERGCEVAFIATEPASISTWLQANEFQRISMEGGPSLLAQFLAEGAVDTLYLTIDPRCTYPIEVPAFAEAAGPARLRLRLEEHYAHPDGTLFLRYAR